MFPKTLYENNLAPVQDTKILIQIDTVEQWYDFVFQPLLIQKFETRTLYNVAPISLLLAHKIYTCFERKRMKRRDFFDILFILKKTQSPDYWYLKQKLGIQNAEEVCTYLLTRSKDVNFDQLHADVAPFLFDTNNQSVMCFRQIIEQTEFGVKQMIFMLQYYVFYLHQEILLFYY